MALRAFIAGCSGPALTAEERAFFTEARPCGFVLFARNCVDPVQTKDLIDDVRSAVSADDLLVLVDQEGGRVQRLRPPHWRAYPPPAAFGRLYGREPQRAIAVARLVSRLMAEELRGLGITVDCTPVLDVPVAGAHEVIGDRAFSDHADTVIALGRAVCEGLLSGGVLPVIKHVPGHGRARADSHATLPVIDADLDTLSASDFRPFRALNDMPVAMTAHVLLAALDCDRAATVSPVIMQQVIRGLIGFDGLVVSDDISMGALSGGVAERTQAALAAGVDVVLHCNGRLDEMLAVAETAPQLSGKSEERFARAAARLGVPDAFDEAAAEAARAELIASV